MMTEKLKYLFCSALFALACITTSGQIHYRHKVELDTAYQHMDADIIKRFKNTPPGPFGSFVKGVKEDIDTDKRIMALTFDACGGVHGDGYDQQLVDYLRAHRIPATFFLSGLWIDAHPAIVRDLAADTLFEIENHGLLHRPCSLIGESRYGIHGTQNISAAVDEIALNARKIESFTAHKPLYYRSATATTDEACTSLAQSLGETIISYDLWSGDAIPGASVNEIKTNLLRGARNGAIVIMHMNHPEWNSYEALKEALPELQKQGFTFVKLALHPLKGKH